MTNTEAKTLTLNADLTIMGGPADGLVGRVINFDNGQHIYRGRLKLELPDGTTKVLPPKRLNVAIVEEPVTTEVQAKAAQQALQLAKASATPKPPAPRKRSKVSKKAIHTALRKAIDDAGHGNIGGCPMFRVRFTDGDKTKELSLAEAAKHLSPGDTAKVIVYQWPKGGPDYKTVAELDVAVPEAA